MVDSHPMVRCHANNRAGQPCGHYAPRGQQVCHMHGGKAPQALRKAEERMRDLVHPAITGLAELIAHADQDSVRLSAIRDLLDRTGYKAKIEVEADQRITIEVVRKSAGPALDHGYTNGRAG